MAGTPPDPDDDSLDIGPDPTISEPPGVSHHRGRRTWVIVGVAVVVLGVGAFVGVKAASGGGSKATTAAAQAPADGGQQGTRRGGTFGTLKSIDGPNLTIETGNGNTMVATTSSSTRFTKTVPGAFSDIKVGDRVIAMGAPNGTDAITAERITDNGTMSGALGEPGRGPGQGRRFNGSAPPPSGSNGQNGGTRPDAGGFAGGTVKSISGTTLTLTGPNNQAMTVSTTPTTAVSVLKQVSVGDLTVGQPVVVRGPTNSDGTITANTVQEGAAGFMRRFGGQGPAGGQGAQ
jgi:hypothetical protein